MSTFRRGLQPRPSDVFVLVMGMTGAGKSSFISLCTDNQVVVGHDLRGCTQRVEEYVCRYSPTVNIYLIDTPGFDDTTRSDTDVLKEVAGWLTDSYSNKVKLNGILYMHRITDPRMQGSAMMNLIMFKKLCGHDALKNVTLVTTMWEKVDPDDGTRREDQLRTTPEYWGSMLTQGSRMDRHNNTRDSAMRLLKRFVKQPDATLSIQQEMVLGKKSLNDTEAGKELNSELAKAEERFKKKLEDTESMMQEALKARDREAAEGLRQHEAAMNKKLERIRREREELKVSMQKLHAEKAEKLGRLEERLEEREEEADMLRKAARELKEELVKVQSDHRKQEKERKAEVARLEKAVAAATARIASNNRSSAALVPSPSSVTYPNRIGEYMSLTLCGGRYYFCGPAKDWRSHDESDAKTGEIQKYVSLGKFGTWYRHYHVQGKKGDCWTQRSSSLESVYPSLEKLFAKSSWRGCPTVVSLGDKGYYFIRVGNAYYYSLPSSITGAVKDWTQVRRLWLGHEDAYVLEKFDGSYSWNLHKKPGTYYEDMTTHLKVGDNGCTTVKEQDLAMDIEVPTRYIIIFTNGSTKFRLAGATREAALDFTIRNCGATWTER